MTHFTLRGSQPWTALTALVTAASDTTMGDKTKSDEVSLLVSPKLKAAFMADAR